MPFAARRFHYAIRMESDIMERVLKLVFNNDIVSRIGVFARFPETPTESRASLSCQKGPPKGSDAFR